MKKGLLILALGLVLAISFTSMAYAQNPIEKLTRGAINTVTGWIEIPQNIYEASIEDNILNGITLGAAKGIGMAIIRTSAGLYDVTTFPFDIPEGYVPILEPEFIYSEENIEVVPELVVVIE